MPQVALRCHVNRACAHIPSHIPLGAACARLITHGHGHVHGHAHDAHGHGHGHGHGHDAHGHVHGHVHVASPLYGEGSSSHRAAGRRRILFPRDPLPQGSSSPGILFPSTRNYLRVAHLGPARPGSAQRERLGLDEARLLDSLDGEGRFDRKRCRGAAVSTDGLDGVTRSIKRGGAQSHRWLSRSL